jgi:hypothetical protein
MESSILFTIVATVGFTALAALGALYLFLASSKKKPEP